MSGPLAIVTGANGNLGLAVVERLTQQGLLVARVERRALKLGEAFECAIDLSKPESVELAFAEVARQAGPLAAVVHTVGAYRGGQPLVGAPEADFFELFQTNVMTTVNVLRAALRVMMPQRAGRIAVVSSKDALAGPADHAAYSASKAAQLRVVESAAAEAKPHGIAINAVLPGTMDTPQNRAAMPQADRSAWLQLGDVAAVLAYLVSPASAAIHGQALQL